jgi:hypothetical protein
MPSTEIDWGLKDDLLAESDAREYLSDPHLALWKEVTSKTRTHIYSNRIFVVWTFDDIGKVQVLDALFMGKFAASFDQGVAVQIYSKEQNLVQVLDQKPQRLFEYDIFAWLPYRNNLQWKPHPHDERRKHLCSGLTLRLRSPTTEEIPGHHYLNDVGHFRKQFQQFANQKF